MRVVNDRRPPTAMTENADLEKRLSDLERRHDKTRGFLIDFMALVTALAAAAGLDQTYEPASGFYTFIVVFAICYGIMKRLYRWLMKD